MEEFQWFVCCGELVKKRSNSGVKNPFSFFFNRSDIFLRNGEDIIRCHQLVGERAFFHFIMTDQGGANLKNGRDERI